MKILSFPFLELPLVVTALALVALVVCAIVWVVRNPNNIRNRSVKEIVQDFFHDVLEVLHPAIDYLARWWEFFGPRLTDRSFLTMVATNVAMLNIVGLDPRVLNGATIAIWVLANLLHPTWSGVKTGDRLRPAAPKPSAAPQP